MITLKKRSFCEKFSKLSLTEFDNLLFYSLINSFVKISLT